MIEGGYKIIVSVVAFDQKSVNMIFWRLIEGSVATENPLIMNSYVYMTEPSVFQKCLEWKEKEIKKIWNDFCRMDSAVP